MSCAGAVGFGGCFPLPFSLIARVLSPGRRGGLTSGAPSGVAGHRGSERGAVVFVVIVFILVVVIFVVVSKFGVVAVPLRQDWRGARALGACGEAWRPAERVTARCAAGGGPRGGRRCGHVVVGRFR
jgi:hypothetical protein